MLEEIGSIEPNSVPPGSLSVGPDTVSELVTEGPPPIEGAEQLPSGNGAFSDRADLTPLGERLSSADATRGDAASTNPEEVTAGSAAQKVAAAKEGDPEATQKAPTVASAATNPARTVQFAPAEIARFNRNRYPQAAMAAETLRRLLPGWQIFDEANHPFRHTTGPHIHVGQRGVSSQEIVSMVKDLFPDARITSTFRRGSSGLHGSANAVDFSFGPPGGAAMMAQVPSSAAVAMARPPASAQEAFSPQPPVQGTELPSRVAGAYPPPPSIDPAIRESPVQTAFLDNLIGALGKIATQDNMPVPASFTPGQGVATQSPLPATSNSYTDPQLAILLLRILAGMRAGGGTGLQEALLRVALLLLTPALQSPSAKLVA